MFQKLIDTWKHFLTWWKRDKSDFISELINQPISITEGNLRSNCENILIALEPILNNPYDPKLGSGILVSSIQEDFIQLTNQLKGINKDLTLDKYLTAIRCMGDLKELSLDSLFISQNKQYIQWKQVINFHEEALKLCTLTKHFEQSTHGKEEHNLRILATVFLSIRSVSGGLLQVLS